MKPQVGRSAKRHKEGSFAHHQRPLEAKSPSPQVLQKPTVKELLSSAVLHVTMKTSQRAQLEHSGVADFTLLLFLVSLQLCMRKILTSLVYVEMKAN